MRSASGGGWRTVVSRARVAEWRVGGGCRLEADLRCLAVGCGEKRERGGSAGRRRPLQVFEETRAWSGSAVDERQAQMGDVVC